MPHSSSEVAVSAFARQQTDFTATPYLQKFSVQFEYPVYFTDQLFNPENTVLLQTLSRLEHKKHHRIIVFIDDGVVTKMPTLPDEIRHYSNTHKQHIDLVCEPISMPGGEKLKSDLHFLEQMQKLLADNNLDRHSYVIAIGGGAMLDAVGLVAATSHRGIRHIRIPTTVLSQNDSGVGVKNGVNLFGQKNYFGTFSPPFAVLNDYNFIRSLSQRDKICGMAEAVKVALIRDESFYNWLEQNADHLALFKEAEMRTMIQRCAELHMVQIAHGGDPFETGSARPLDFGHWAAHKLETITGYQLRHGEAVAIGLALDTHYSVLCGLLAEGEDNRVCTLLEHLGFKLWHPALELQSSNGEPQVLAGLADFREHLGGKLTITLLQTIGRGTEVNEMDDGLVKKSIQWLKTRQE